jgi:restriction system protein
MTQRTFNAPDAPIPFVGREDDLAWLREEMPERFGYRSDDDIAIIGEAGIGKTALVAEHLHRNARVIPSVWLDCVEWQSSDPDLRAVFDIREKRRDQGVDRFRGFIVVIDGAESMSSRRLSDIYLACRNRKSISQVIVTSRKRPEIRIGQVRHLGRLSGPEAEHLIRTNVSLTGLNESELLHLLAIANGHPEAARILTGLAGSLSNEQLRRVLTGDIYRLDGVNPGLNALQISRVAKPLIIADNERIIRELKSRPEDLYSLSPRQFEEVIADLLQDMDYEVTLTQQTRDGGKDILAAKKTELGDILCLVDAKRYSKSHKIGVSMVRTLLGTLADYQATCAMLATTSSYSRDAYAMQQKHKYKLSLKDFADIVSWIQRFGSQGSDRNRLG